MVRKLTGVFALLLFCVTLSHAGAPLDEARQHFTAKNYKKTVKCAKKVLKNDPGNITAGFLLAESYGELKKYRKSIDVYKDLIARNPENTDAMFGLGAVYNKSEHPRNAADAFNQVVLLEPDNKLARYWLGVSLAACMDLNKAYGEYRVLKKQDPALADDLLKKIHSNY